MLQIFGAIPFPTGIWIGCSLVALGMVEFLATGGWHGEVGFLAAGGLDGEIGLLATGGLAWRGRILGC